VRSYVLRAVGGLPPDDGRVTVRMLLPGAPAPGEIDGLAVILVDATADGVSAGFLAPLTPHEAAQWWTRSLGQSQPRTWIAEHSGEIVGCVRLVPAAYPADPHRADVVKLLVRTDHRGHGHGRDLMATLEEHAAATGRWLLTLTTETGRPAETIYERWGWRRYGHLLSATLDEVVGVLTG